MSTKIVATNILDNVDDTVVLDKVKNVDGAGSGLDADLFQGKDPDYFLQPSVSEKLFLVRNIKGEL